LCVSYSFDGVPRLNSAKALAKYAFFAVILAPRAGALVGALAISGDYWIGWRICFFSEALAFLTLTPAILSWVSEARAWSQKSRADYLEAVGRITCIGFFRVCHVRRFWEKHSTSTVLFSNALFAVVRFAFRIDGGFHFGDCRCLFVDLGCSSRPRSLHRIRGAQQRVVAAAIHIFRRDTLYGSRSPCGGA
jgi:hypothetical protein